jgi:hypothetical protein
MEIAPWRIRSLTKLVYSQPFELLIAFVILINATSLAILTMPDLDPQIREACEQIDLICFAIYGAELVLRIHHFFLAKPPSFVSSDFSASCASSAFFPKFAYSLHPSFALFHH